MAFLEPMAKLKRVMVHSTPEIQLLVVRMGKLNVSGLYIQLRTPKVALKELFTILDLSRGLF